MEPVVPVDDRSARLVGRARALALWALVVPLPVGAATWLWAFHGDAGRGPGDRWSQQFAALLAALVVGSIVATGLAAAAMAVMRHAHGHLTAHQQRVAVFTRRLVTAELVLGTLVLAPVVVLALDASERLSGERSVAFVVALGIPLLVWAIAAVTDSLVERRLRR